ncbi:TIP41-like family-domain-containing protein, partial [Thamnocephalis sphaerospora]
MSSTLPSAGLQRPEAATVAAQAATSNDASKSPFATPRPSLQPHLTEQPPRRTLEFRGWTVETCKKPILSSTEIERAEAALSLPMPEMIFGNNYLSVTHAASGFQLSFRALDALRHVAVGHEAARSVQVAYAEDWARTRDDPEEKVEVVKPYDWTYSTDYRGTITAAKQEQQTDAAPLAFTPTEKAIDYDRLRQREQILFFDDVVLFEDELADNGTALLTAKVRVMPTGFFILQRLFMRVDGVLLRMNETRVYHAFGTDHVLREYTCREDRYQTV